MFTTVLLAVLAINSVNAINVNPGYDVDKVRQQMINLAAHSWEWGTASEALLELDTPELSVFGLAPFPIPSHPSSPALDYARQHIYLNSSILVPGDGRFLSLPNCTSLSLKILTILHVGAVGDPASLGVSAVLIGKTDQAYIDAAEREKNYIFQAPRWPNGAISHRIEVAELW